MDKENSIPCGLTIRCFEFNMIGENCYVVSDETRDCVIIDCGAYWKDEREELVEYITKNELRPVRLLATHGHLDHHFGDNTVYDTYGLSPELSEEDEYVYKSLLYQAEKYFHLKLNYKFPAPGRYLQDGETPPRHRNFSDRLPDRCAALPYFSPPLQKSQLFILL